MSHFSVAKQHISCVKFPYYGHAVDGLCYEVRIMKSRNALKKHRVSCHYQSSLKIMFSFKQVQHGKIIQHKLSPQGFF